MYNIRCAQLLYSMFFGLLIHIFFFFQAEDGIRDLTVTGVQTCALPIWSLPTARSGFGVWPTTDFPRPGNGWIFTKIGRASCRERVYISVVDVSLKKKGKCFYQ